MVAAPALDDFERYLVEVIEAAPPDANRPLVREHFALDDPSAKRGKRLRPLILLTVAAAEGAAPRAAYGAAAALELLHNFSLIHDDIEDGDELRHGRRTLWARHGIAAALVAGNAMSALSYLTLIDGSRDLPIERVAAMASCLQRAHFRMCEGQAFDIGFERAVRVTFDEYTRMIDGKTAALLSASCELGALAAGCGPVRAAAYGEVGRVYGLAFQVRDDVLGTWGLPAETGKPSGADIRRRKWSFPVAWALAGASSPEQRLIAEAYAAIGPLAEQTADAVIAALDRLGARAAADAACDRYIGDATRTAESHALDLDGTLAALLSATSKRTA
jgi:geranylgeranyl diphosphate synthase type I